MPDALQLLRQDHMEVKELFRRFESSEDKREKEEIAAKTIVELVVHSMIEEEIFYPAVRQELASQGEEEEEIMYEAEEEHHVVDLLIEELTKMDASDENFDAKYKVMAENVKHHIQEEESMMLPKAAELGGGMLEQLGQEMYDRKMALLEEFQGTGRTTRRRSTNGRTPSRGRTTTRSTNGRRRTTTGTTARRRSTTRATRGTGSTRTRTAARTTTRRTARPASRSTSRTSARAGTRTTARAGTRARTAARTAARTPATRTRTGSGRTTARARR